MPIKNLPFDFLFDALDAESGGLLVRVSAAGKAALSTIWPTERKSKGVTVELKASEEAQQLLITDPRLGLHFQAVDT